MKRNPVDGGRYRKSVRGVKVAANVIARKCEANFNLPRGSVKICITKLPEKTRDRLATSVA